MNIVAILRQTFPELTQEPFSLDDEERAIQIHAAMLDTDEFTYEHYESAQKQILDEKMAYAQTQTGSPVIAVGLTPRERMIAAAMALSESEG